MLRLRLRFPDVVHLCLLRHITAHFEPIEIYDWVVRAAHLHHAFLLIDGARERRIIVCVTLVYACNLLAIFVEADLVHVQLLGIVQLLRHVQQIPSR